MKVTKMTKNKAQDIKTALSPQLIAHPLFMFYCPEKSKREKYINKFLDYYLFSWAKYGECYVSLDRKAVVSLVSVAAFEYKFSGKNSFGLKLDKNAYRIKMHRESVEAITDVVVPQRNDTRVMTIYASPAQSMNEIKELVEEIQAHAKEKGFALVYETFSRKLVDFMTQQGFETSYQKQFLNTQFVQTVMVYNV